ncbi:ATPase [Colletotrichum nymphaeae SA-01]|uniref:ATPase n=1 Tax=Colletotrichum nymphaeae SA-01 TaxID=1460502 RepID=A0A135TBT5_9PEZI|nr:ATPase [Colletotrichum nymphaeae SA-01]
MGGQADNTIDDDAGSTVSFEEVDYRRTTKQSQALVARGSLERETPSDILYVLQYLGIGGKVIDSRESSNPFKEIPDYGKKDGETTQRTVNSVLEIVTKVNTSAKIRRVRRRRSPHITYPDDDYTSASSDSEEDDERAKAGKIERTQMIIHSPHLINALRAVVAYYPHVNLLGDTVAIDAPYRVIVHHLDALRQYRFHQPASHSTEYARLTANHIDVLLSFIDQAVGESIRTEQERHSRNVPVATFQNYWMALKPGEVIYVNHDDLWEPHVISSTFQDVTLSGRNRHLQVIAWVLEMGHNRMNRKMSQFTIPSWTGEQIIPSLKIIPARFFQDDPQAMLQKQLRLGKLYWELLQRPTYMEYDGMLVQAQPGSHSGPIFSRGPSGYMTGRVICDAEGFGRFNFRAPENRNGPPGPPRGVVPPGMMPVQHHGPPPAQDHLPHFLPRCGCKECTKETDRTDLSPFAGFDDINPLTSPAPTSDVFYIACTNIIPAFLLGDRRWGHLNLDHVKPVITDREAFKYLVLDDEIKMTVKALIGKFAAAESGKVSPWANDFIKNKGEGRIFLLHGAPGVGKTCTAECVAELTNRPLISLTSGDLSVNSHSVEHNLSYFLELGQRFGALVLLDEADVYLERRRAKDIARNGLVSVFLRALEYYRGVLFLTTNRVQAFDAAFTSRIHVALHYKNLTDVDRERIWANNFERLDRDSHGRVRVAIATREYAYDSRDVRALRWNGREIRNALQTALALAESDAAEEGTDRICVTDKHLRAVVKMSRGFRDYLRSGSVPPPLPPHKPLNTLISQNLIPSPSRHNTPLNVGTSNVEREPQPPALINLVFLSITFFDPFTINIATTITVPQNPNPLPPNTPPLKPARLPIKRKVPPPLIYAPDAVLRAPIRVRPPHKVILHLPDLPLHGGQLSFLSLAITITITAITVTTKRIRDNISIHFVTRFPLRTGLDNFILLPHLLPTTTPPPLPHRPPQRPGTLPPPLRVLPLGQPQIQHIPLGKPTPMQPHPNLPLPKRPRQLLLLRHPPILIIVLPISTIIPLRIRINLRPFPPSPQNLVPPTIPNNQTPRTPAPNLNNMIPKTMHPRLRRIPIQPLGVRVPGQPVHHRPAHAARRVHLQPEVVVRARDRVVVLVHHKVRAPFGANMREEEGPQIAVGGEVWRTGRVRVEGMPRQVGEEVRRRVELRCGAGF